MKKLLAIAIIIAATSCGGGDIKETPAPVDTLAPVDTAHTPASDTAKIAAKKTP
jgi:hypothetical protein